MKEIVHCKFSLFQLEEMFFFDETPTGRNTCVLLGTYNSLDEAKYAQEKLKFKTIILPSY